MSDEVLNPLLGAMQDLLDWMHHLKVRGIIIGGVAVSLLSRPRVTRDIDVLVLLESERWDEFFDAAKKFGFLPRLQNCMAFARNHRVLLVSHGPTSIDIDIYFGGLPFEEESLDRSVSIEVGDMNISLPSPEDLIIMKAVAHRPIDLADINAIFDTHSGLDMERMRHWIREFSSVLEMPEIYDDFEDIVAKKR